MMQRIALIAHDARKPDMLAFVKENRETLSWAELFSTGDTGEQVRQAGLDVVAKLSGPLGGDAQIGAMVAEGLLDAVVFFRDPLGNNAHEADVQMLMRLCDVHRVLLATNPTTAHYLVEGLVKTGALKGAP